ncbi:hypothetical protein ACEN9J_02865 [Variovorax sp. Varisp41]|uniref:hypothetical protein n=1 Tax=Variovorax sp. Varisp41 TaxID=3243033 RepID=UPI0039B6752B
MSTITKRRASQLVEEVRSVNVSSHAHASRCRDRQGQLAFFVGDLEVVLQHFLRENGCSEAAEALRVAMNDVPTSAEIDAHNAKHAALFSRKTGSTA